jgi:regulator of protease activity HflC (stomatin/prohibitin superfamily)
MSLRIQQIDCRCETKTKDNVFVDIKVTVQYQIEREHLYDAFYKLTDSRAQIMSYVFDEVRAQVPKIPLDEVFLAKEEIALAIKAELTKSMSGFGYAIIQTLITDIEPAAKVKAAMNEINAAQRLRLAAYEHSEGEKIRVVKAAEADAEAKYLAGQVRGADLFWAAFCCSSRCELPWWERGAGVGVWVMLGLIFSHSLKTHALTSDLARMQIP